MSERTIGRALRALTLGLMLSLAGLVGYLEIRGHTGQWQPKNCHHH
jgi:hypothetical protein